jgi:NADH-quinone oxidoreductase subunit K
LTGPTFVLFSIAIAAAEAAVGLAIILMVFRHTRSTDLNRLDSLHG